MVTFTSKSRTVTLESRTGVCTLWAQTIFRKIYAKEGSMAMCTGSSAVTDATESQGILRLMRVYVQIASLCQTECLRFRSTPRLCSGYNKQAQNKSVNILITADGMVLLIPCGSVYSCPVRHAYWPMLLTRYNTISLQVQLYVFTSLLKTGASPTCLTCSFKQSGG